MAEYTNAEKMKLDEEELAERLKNLEREELPTANIIVAGITGAGKSTLLNAIFGSELAETGKGRAVTSIWQSMGRRGCQYIYGIQSVWNWTRKKRNNQFWR